MGTGVESQDPQTDKNAPEATGNGWWTGSKLEIFPSPVAALAFLPSTCRGGGGGGRSRLQKSSAGWSRRLGREVLLP